jgi:hypothetical protein
MSNRRDMFILLGLFGVLVVFTLLGPGRSRDETFSSTPTSHSSAPRGALALFRWVEGMGYDARRLEYTHFSLEDGPDALFILNPTEAINRTQTEMILEWVEGGRTLVLVDSRSAFFGGGNQLLRELDIQVQSASDEVGQIERASVLQPALYTPPVQDVLVRTEYVVRGSRSDVAPLVGVPIEEQADDEEAGESPAEENATGEEQVFEAVLVGLKQGDGYIYVSSAIFPFTNEGLRDEQNAGLVLNLLRSVPRGGVVVFDEWHHGFHTPPSLRSVVLSNPWGQAVVYSVLVVAVYLVWTGRRFGRPVPLQEDVALRSSAEYVENMADLLQRGRKHDFLLRHYQSMCKRRIARPYGINPQLADADFIAELKQFGGEDAEQFGPLLKQLDTQDVSEEELVRIVAAATTELDTRKTTNRNRMW